MHFERAADILRGVEQAPALGVAAPPADADLVEVAAHRAVPQSRIRAARSWLFALGYLTRDEDRSDYDPALTAAVARFQEDAGLVVDGWIGTTQTWPRLQELVTFEEPLKPEHWQQSDGRPRAALARGVRLRLAVYGLEGDDALGLLDDLLVALGADGLSPESRFERYASALDHDALVRRVADAAQDDGPLARMMANPRHMPLAVEIWGLMLNFAKVELWLAQEAEVDLTTAYRGRLRFGRDLVLPGELRRDMAQYMTWADAEIEGVSGLRGRFRRAVRGEAPFDAVRLFLSSVAEHGQVQEPFAPDRLELIERFYGGKSDQVPKRAQETVRALSGEARFRSRLWDGLRRLWSWMKTALTRAIRTGKRVLKLARDLAAYVFQAASEGLRLVAGALGAFLRHAPGALSRTRVDPRGWIGIRRDLGRDVTLVVSRAAPPAYLEGWTEVQAMSAAIFRRSASVIGDAIALGLSVASMLVSGPLVLRSLIGAMRDLRRSLSVLGEIARLQERHDILEERLARMGA